jgi:hypothetical protein
MSVSVLIEAVEAEGFGGGAVVASAFGDVQVAGVFDGCDDGGPDGGQVGRTSAGAAGRGIFTEGHVADVVMRLDRAMLADEAGQVLRGGVGAGEGRGSRHIAAFRVGSWRTAAIAIAAMPDYRCSSAACSREQ